MHKIQFLWNPSAGLKALFSDKLSGCGFDLVFPETTANGEFIYPEIDRAEALVGWRISKNNLKKAKNCRLFLVPGHGVKRNVDLIKTINLEKRITLVNSHGNAYATAQHALALLLSLTNKIIRHHQFMKSGKFRTSDEEGATFLLREKTVGFLGYGAINKLLHQFLTGFDLDFKVLKRTVSAEEKANGVFTPGQLHSFLKMTDILIVGVPFTSNTENLVGEKELALLGPSALIINVSRGPIINEAALYKALESRWVAGAGIDVWYNYKPEPDEKGRHFPFQYPFHKLDNIVLSPHRGGSPLDNPYRFEDVIDNLRRFAQGLPLKNVVDLDREY